MSRVRSWLPGDRLDVDEGVNGEGNGPAMTILHSKSVFSSHWTALESCFRCQFISLILSVDTTKGTAPYTSA